jgi:2-keto-4-pentenoate hydratase/2-oxohepta-3-ene-1,7-dioic acid hydratase in catechol pathway
MSTVPLLPGDVILSGKPGGVGGKRKAALVDLINKKRFRSADHEKVPPGRRQRRRPD